MMITLKTLLLISLIFRLTEGCVLNSTLTTPVNITSPNYPSDYPADVSCIWRVWSDLGTVILIEVIDISVESCCDHLLLYNGNYTDENSVLSETASGRVYTASNGAVISFTSDSSVERSGFFLRLTQTSACSEEVIEHTPIIIARPFYPENYKANTSCVWRINSETQYVIRINILAISIEKNLYIYDGDDTDSDELVHGYHSGIIYTSSNQVLVIFSADAEQHDQGFKIAFTRISDCTLGKTYKTPGTITSPNYPNNYPSDVSCIWQIISDPGSVIQIAVSVIEVEMCCDHLYIYDGEGTKAELISSKAEPHTLYTTGNRAYITFSSDGSLERIGFSISYVTLSACENGMTANTPIDIASPVYHPHVYPERVFCSWNIRSDRGSKIRVNVSFPLNDDSSHHLHIYDGNSNSSVRIWEKGNASIVHTTTNQVFVTFSSDDYDISRGFSASIIQRTDCTEELSVDSSVNITSPYYPEPYPASLSCSWYLETDPDSLFEIKQNMLLIESCCDFLHIFNGTTTESALYWDGHFLHSISNQVLITFSSDASIEEDGFALTVTKIPACSYDTSMNFPVKLDFKEHFDDYSRSISCFWKFTSKLFDTRIQIQLNSLIYNDHQYLYIYDGSTDQMARIYSNDKGICFTSTNQVIVLLSNYEPGDEHLSVLLTELTATTVNLSTPTYISSPGYPATYPHNSNFTWLITSPADTKIQVVFLEFDLEPQYDFVSIYDGADQEAELLFIESDIPRKRAVISTSNKIYINFQSDNAVQTSGFSATVNSNLGCDEKEMSGLANMTWPSNTADCLWIFNETNSKTTPTPWEPLSFITPTTAPYTIKTGDETTIDTSESETMETMGTKISDSELETSTTYVSRAQEVLLSSIHPLYTTETSYVRPVTVEEMKTDKTKALQTDNVILQTTEADTYGSGDTSWIETDILAGIMTSSSNGRAEFTGGVPMLPTDTIRASETTPTRTCELKAKEHDNQILVYILVGVLVLVVGIVIFLILVIIFMKRKEKKKKELHFYLDEPKCNTTVL